MVSRTTSLWSRSLTWRLMAPVGLMFLLVALLTLVSVGTRTRLHHAYDALSLSQDVRTDLIEVRSVSRSLQRDALNLLSETDPGELRVLHDKYRTRTADMRRRLRALETKLGFRTAERAPYLRGQRDVIAALTGVSHLAHAGRRRDAWRMFRARVRPEERAASRIADDLILLQDGRVAALNARADALERQEIVLSTLASILLFAAAAGLTLLIARRSVLRPLSDIERAMTSVALGDTAGETPHVARHDEIGRMAQAIEVFRASVRERERLRAQEERLRRQAFEQELSAEQAARRSDEAAAARSLSLARSAQLLQAEVGEVLGKLRSSSADLSRTARDLTDTSAGALRGLDDVGGAVARAVGGMTDIAAANQQFTGAIDDASRRTRRTADLSADAAAQSTVLAARMARVQDAAREIEAVVNLIAGIAKQTNLLALNAGMEAARSGEAGQGFAVVASEVKQLAGQTARATDQIAGQIADVQLAAHDAGESLRSIENMIADMAREAEALALGIAEQAQSGRTIHRNLAGAAADLDLIDGRVRYVAGLASGVDALAGRTREDAAALETAATSINGSLSAFFADLDSVRAQIRRPEPRLS